MIIGIPKALLYYRYGCLWESFFALLGCGTVTSHDTDYDIMKDGSRYSHDENCLPAKNYLGHVRSLIGKCDYILVPRFEDVGKNDIMCERFLGIYDTVRNTCPGAPLIDYNLCVSGHKSERMGFVKMGTLLGKAPAASLLAYQKAKGAQREQDKINADRQNSLLDGPGAKVLLVSQGYISHDPHMGGPLTGMLESLGVIPIYSDYCDREACKEASLKISQRLYWTLNKESIGSIPLLKSRVDGIILLSAYPCGTDSLVNELVMRKVSGVPLIQLTLDGQQAQEGLQTRIESFVDILTQRRRSLG